MQNLFATQKYQLPTQQNGDTSMIKPQDFNTMQNLFATINPQNGHPPLSELKNMN